MVVELRNIKRLKRRLQVNGSWILLIGFELCGVMNSSSISSFQAHSWIMENSERSNLRKLRFYVSAANRDSRPMSIYLNVTKGDDQLG